MCVSRDFSEGLCYVFAPFSHFRPRAHLARSTIYLFFVHLARQMRIFAPSYPPISKRRGRCRKSPPGKYPPPRAAQKWPKWAPAQEYFNSGPAGRDFGNIWPGSPPPPRNPKIEHLPRKTIDYVFVDVKNCTSPTPNAHFCFKLRPISQRRRRWCDIPWDTDMIEIQIWDTARYRYEKTMNKCLKHSNINRHTDMIYREIPMW